LNRNRLNVAISRAQIACFVVCAEGLFGSKCNTVEQLSLLSTFTSLKRYSHDSFVQDFLKKLEKYGNPEQK